MKSFWKPVSLCLMFVSACSPLSSAPYQQPLDVIIGQTAAAAQTQTATYAPSVTPTLTSTVTATPRIPSATPTVTFAFGILLESASTPVVVETSNPLLLDSNGGFTTSVYHVKRTPEPWACTIVNKDPSKGETVKPGTRIYISWTVVNTGTKTWTVNGVDFVFDGGYDHEGGPIQDFHQTVFPGGDVTLRVLIFAPKRQGSYNEIWALKVGNTKFCHMELAFKVK